MVVAIITSIYFIISLVIKSKNAEDDEIAEKTKKTEEETDIDEEVEIGETDESDTLEEIESKRLREAFEVEENIKKNKFKLLRIILNVLVIVSSLFIICLNLILIVRLKQQPLKNKIGPEHIRMGFFNPNEIELIQNGHFTQNNYDGENVIGRLSDLIESANYYNNYKIYSFEINCSNQRGRRETNEKFLLL